MKRRSLREMAVRVVLLLIGLWIAHLGVTLFLQTNLGSDPFNVFVQGLFRAIPWPEWAGMTHGRVHLLVSLLIMVVLLVVDRSYVGIGTVLCMALGGPIIDVYTLWLAPFLNETLPLAVRVPMLAVGCVIAPRRAPVPTTWWRWCSATRAGNPLARCVSGWISLSLWWALPWEAWLG